ncbi:2-oxoglutarate dehydrogenase E1 component [Streptomyces sp. 1222.5]|uniref:thiamine pyrophosphate-dependent enzyme n=1 Tax=unclassified Streptomyces TaxID=2593676 RepID=UPI000896B53E|nr:MULTISPECIES: thiamine pyrophosphate-dependent enzyme [unclassified Streptomyces]PKW05299.1 transketolase-like protein [Streptomyces sp. 5112.2]SED44253.1 2-oxoglutarate dehydrogenase E1 component [Streptomyces sp. 1222.5]
MLVDSELLDKAVTAAGPVALLFLGGWENAWRTRKAEERKEAAADRASLEARADELVTAVLALKVAGNMHDQLYTGWGAKGRVMLAALPQGGAAAVRTPNRMIFWVRSRYATDVARVVEAPIFHVNGDDPEAVGRVARLAFDSRQTFHRDVVVDLVCYRRHGHSEVDDPSVTQPVTYALTDARPSARRTYAESLVARGDIGERQVEAARRTYRDRLETPFAETRALPAPAEGVPAAGRRTAARAIHRTVTAIDEKTARQVIAAQTDLPQGFTVHPRVLPRLYRRTATLDIGAVDWATAETLAIGSLLLEGHPVRLAGQDSRRGTFGQRHAVLTDRLTGAEHTPLRSLGPRAAGRRLRTARRCCPNWRRWASSTDKRWPARRA